ncbi:hypothetical protein Rvan_3204 [Rhodomicrobium vannielii ATCC 17100]|uniref:Uncharacterized protein n=1 Tax=Rhodomicrobium vannielii (strain ATCC 17100 / DSM 162 / LMG 4299 / NCIMB 10020 / ATH 3.1.1) TaxID=648757 RepID=E3I1M4_RHOVT|nr:hypothetical protein Rvan_3204 [Rhodomicrobium vannielii ATCC 17100]
MQKTFNIGMKLWLICIIGTAYHDGLSPYNSSRYIGLQFYVEAFPLMATTHG